MAMMPKPRTRLLRSNEEGEMAVQDNAFGFNHVVRGYNPDEVNDYINNLSDSYRNTQTVLNRQREEFETEKEMLVCEINDMKESRDTYKQQAEEYLATIEELRDEILALASGEGLGGVDESTAKEMSRLMEENSKLQQEMQAVNNKNDELKDELHKTKEENEVLKNSAEAGGADSAAAIAKQRELEEIIEQLKADKSSVESKLASAQKQLENASAGGDADEELEVLRVENNDLVEKNRSLSIEMAKAQKKARMATEEAEMASGAKKELEDNIAKLMDEKSQLADSVAQITSEKDALADSIAQITSEKDTLADSIAQIASEKDALADSIAQISSEKEALAGNYESMKSDYEAKTAELIAAKAEHEELVSKTNAIKEKLASLMEVL